MVGQHLPLGVLEADHRILEDVHIALVDAGLDDGDALAQSCRVATQPDLGITRFDDIGLSRLRDPFEARFLLGQTHLPSQCRDTTFHTDMIGFHTFGEGLIPGQQEAAHLAGEIKHRLSEAVDLDEHVLRVQACVRLGLNNRQVGQNHPGHRTERQDHHRKSG